LAEPPLGDAAVPLAANLEAFSRWEHDFQGRSGGHLRDLARREILDRSREYLRRFGMDVPPNPAKSSPAIVTGHQPELFHPGVWVKNFAISAIAGNHGGFALNLIVDEDIPKSSSVRVPECAGGDLKATVVHFDDWAVDAPYEDWTVRDEARFAAFPERVRSTLGGLIGDPVIHEFWPLAIQAGAITDRVGLRFAAARRGVERNWGVSNWEVPLSAVCDTDAFRWFLCHLLAHLPRFHEVHRTALARYRALYHIRSRHHPVPDLGREGDWLEAPFWAWRSHEPRRRPLMARQLGRSIQLRIQREDAPLIELPLGPDREACCAVEQLRELSGRQIRLRTRALSTTMFARMLISDLFLHGIGGAKYDELGDEIVRRFFGIEPPRYLTLSMTLWLGLPTDPYESADLHRIARLLRDLKFNPDRHLAGAERHEGRPVIAAKRRAIGRAQATRAERLARLHEIRQCNEALQPFVGDQRQRLEHERLTVLSSLRRNGLALSRDYAFVLHSRQRLKEAFGRVAAAALPSAGTAFVAGPPRI
jgi:hypothetical protein